MATSCMQTIFFLFVLIVAPSLAAAQTPPERQDPYSGYARVTPSMAIIIVVLIAALFFMGFFSIYIRHCSNSSGGVSVRALANGSRRAAAAARGLEASVIETFPTLVYSEVKGLKIGKSALECAVCLCEFEDDETLRLIPKCDHVFHPDCIDAWLASHTTCPVCRADLTPQPGDPAPQLPERDLEAQNQAASVVESEYESCDQRDVELAAPAPEVVTINQTLNRNRTRGSRSDRPRRFPRSHSTGHSLVQPGENTDRFTLRLPDEVRKQILKRKLNRTTSLVVFTSQTSSRMGYKVGDEGSSRGKNKRPDQLDQGTKSDRWVFGRTQSFLTRASSFLTRASSSVRSPKVAANNGEGTSTRPVGPNTSESSRPPV